MIYNYKDIKRLHLEITDKCNASCPMCSRNMNGGRVNPHLPITELTLDDIKTMFPAEFIQQLDSMYMCGNYGDPIVARDTIPVYKYFRECNPTIHLSMNTNGSARPAKWWEELGEVLGQKGHVVFGIDGLLDTNRLYRKDTNFVRIIVNAQAFMNGGGRARWDFIVFRHNEHQIEEARSLSETLGFEDFRIKKTGRFFSNTKLQAKGSTDVYDRDGIAYTIAPPTDPDLRNMSLEREQKIISEFGSMINYLDHTTIECQVVNKEIYVSAEGLVFPCCWTASQLYASWWGPAGEGEIWDLINRSGGKTAISAKHHTLQSIVEGPFFSNLQQSWVTSSCADGKLQICSRICGKNFNQYKDQYK